MSADARPTPIELVALLGSATQPGRMHRAVTEAIERMSDGVAGEVLDLGTMRIAPADGRPPDTLGDDTAALVARLDAADALVVATPVYRGSLTGTLKNALDHAPVPVLRGKPMGLVAMGASDHHFLGADRHLRDILAFFGALVAPVSVYLTSADFADGVPSESAVARLDGLLETVVGLARTVPAEIATRLAPLGR